MLGSLTVKPLLITVAVLGVLLAGSGYLNTRLYKELGAAKAECVAKAATETNKRNEVTQSLVTSSLRTRVAQLEAELQTYRRYEQVATLRHTEGSAALTEFKDKINEARKTDPSLDERVDVSRLRALEAAYRVRTQRSDQLPVSRDP